MLHSGNIPQTLTNDVACLALREKDKGLMTKNKGQATDIAIIGMSAMFAKAPNLQTYWHNILTKIDAVTEASDTWAKPYFDPDSKDSDRIYTRKAGFLGELAEFDPLEFGIMPNAVDGGEPDQYLALKLARDALRDAGYEQKPFNREKTGVILGRGTYVNRGYTTLVQHGMIVDQTLELLQQLCPTLDDPTLLSLRQGLKDSLPPFTAEMLPGLVPNNVTGRIANRLDLMGPNFIIDAACASSLIAVELGIKELLSGRCEMVLAGGVHASTPPQIYMIFCQLGGLSRSEIRPFDAIANGTLLGEGLGILVLKRRRDAERDGDRIYAVIKGIGSSSDGKGLGLLAPRLEGEVLALQRAYQGSGIDPASIGLIEAHGTSIPLGDKTEIQALSHLFGSRDQKMPSCALGSVKSMIGHCIPAAGVAGMIKTVLALYHKVLPPTLCQQVNPALNIEQTPFYINTQPRPWIHGNPTLPRRAGVNAFGFGGINAHAVLEEYQGAATQRLQQLNSHWSTELLVFSSDQLDGLLEGIEQIRSYLQAQTEPVSLANLAYTLSQQPVSQHRLAIVAQTVQELDEKLKLAQKKLSHTPPKRWQTRNGIDYAQGNQPGKVAFLFPGEGAQYTNMLADLCLYFPQVRQWFDFLDQTFWAKRHYQPSQVVFPAPTSLTPIEQQFTERQLFAMDLGSEVVFTASMGLYELLGEFEISSDAMVGHSTGENAALFASGIARQSSQEQLSQLMRHLNQIYQDLEASDRIPKGALLTVGAVSPDIVAEKVAAMAGRLHLAMDNCRNQVVLFGSEDDIQTISAQLKEQGGICLRLPFDRAYHTRLFEDVARAFRPFYNSLEIESGQIPLYSCATADVFPPEPEAIRNLATRQWSSRVRFRETIETLYERGFRIFVEVGPSSNLTGFVNDILQGRDYLAVASNSRRRSGIEQFLNLLGRLFTNGVNVNMASLYRDRQLTSITLYDVTPAQSALVERHSAKTRSVLELTMPTMTLPSAIVKTVQEKLTPHPQTMPTESTPPSATPINSLTSTSPDSVPWDSSSPTISPLKPTDTINGDHPSQPLTDPRLTLVSAHFDLMQEFLANQGRVMESFYQTLYQNSQSWSVADVPSWEPAETTDSLLVEAAWPFLGQILEHDADHLYCQRQFDLQRDLFLCDHTLGSAVSQRQPELLALPVMPFTFSMEILAEAAHYLFRGEQVVVSMHNLRGYRWLTLDHGKLVLGIHAQRQESSQGDAYQSVYVRCFQLEIPGSASGLLVFEGEVRLANQFAHPPAPMPFDLEQPSAAQLADTDLYCTGMFHGPRLQGVKHLKQWSRQGIEAELQVLPIQEFFSHTQRPILQTDVGLLDAAGQLVGYWLTEQFGADFNCFPFQVTAFYQYTSPLPPGSLVHCRGLIQFTSQQQIEASFDLLNSSGQVIARLEQWQDRYFTMPRHFAECRLHPQTAYLSEPWMQAETGLSMRRIPPFPEHFLEDAWGIWQRVLVHLMLNSAERDIWYHLPGSGSKRIHWLLGRIAAKDAVRQWANQNFGINLAPVDIEIKVTELGKPYAEAPALGSLTIPDLSISHSQTEVIAALAKTASEQIGIDLELYNTSRCHDLVNVTFTVQEQEFLQQVPPSEQDATILSLWCAKEAAAKAMGTGFQNDPQQWQVSRYSPANQQVIVHHQNRDFSVRIWLTTTGILAICLL